MVHLIVGKKGTGKTQKLICSANEAAEKALGSVVCIEKGDSLRYQISSKVRLIDSDEYNILGYDKLYGFICGILASNYDIETLYCDALFRIAERDQEKLHEFILKINKISEGKNIYFSVSCDESELSKENRALFREANPSVKCLLLKSDKIF